MIRYLNHTNPGLWRTLSFMLLLMLASCAQLDKRNSVPFTALQPMPEQWSSRGKLAIRPVDSKAFKATSANYYWQQSGDATTLQLYGALGMGRISIESSASGALIRRGDRVLSQADSLSNLAWHTLGLPLPTENLRHWLTGRPDPARQHQPLRRDELTDLNADETGGFSQAGWTVRYTLPSPDGGRPLPQKLLASDGRVAIRVVVRDWDLDEK